ncbi:glutathione S-transferase C-terminal domain-containing protein, partial [Variovorax sp. 2RAF20]
CGADATVFAFMAGALCPLFETPIRTAAESHPNLVAYVARMRERYYPDLAPVRTA